MIQMIPDKDALIALLDDLNWSGTTPVVAVLPEGQYAEPVLLYGLDLGDEMGFEWYGDPGEEAKWCEASDHHKVLPTHSIDELREGPYTVLHADFSKVSDE